MLYKGYTTVSSEAALGPSWVPQKVLRGVIPCSFLEPFAHSWSHFAGVHRQKSSKSTKIDFSLRVRRALRGSAPAGLADSSQVGIICKACDASTNFVFVPEEMRLLVWG